MPNNYTPIIVFTAYIPNALLCDAKNAGMHYAGQYSHELHLIQTTDETIARQYLSGEEIQRQKTIQTDLFTCHHWTTIIPDEYEPDPEDDDYLYSDFYDYDARDDIPSGTDLMEIKYC